MCIHMFKSWVALISYEIKNKYLTPLAPKWFGVVMKPAVLPCTPLDSWRRSQERPHWLHSSGTDHSPRQVRVVARTQGQFDWHHKDRSESEEKIHKDNLRCMCNYFLNSLLHWCLRRSYHIWDERRFHFSGQQVVPVGGGKERMFLQLHLQQQTRRHPPSDGVEVKKGG